MGEQITLTCKDGVTIGAYLARPSGQPKGAVVVLQEIFGVNQHMRADADKFAAAGYLAIAPHLYDRVEPNVELGYTGDEPKKGMDIRARTELPKTLMEIAAAIEAVKSAGKVGIVGYCWGGTLTFAAACELDGLSAASSYYGGGVSGMADKKPKIPTQMHFGETDHSISMEAVGQIKEKRGGDCEIFVYPAGHGFNCDERASWHQESAELARQRTHAHFAKYLAG